MKITKYVAWTKQSNNDVKTNKKSTGYSNNINSKNYSENTEGKNRIEVIEAEQAYLKIKSADTSKPEKAKQKISSENSNHKKNKSNGYFGWIAYIIHGALEGLISILSSF